MSATANGPTLFGANGQSLTKKQKDAFGRVLTHNATVEDVYQIVIDECAKVHEYYLTQIPQYTARMIQDALVSYGLVQLTEPASGPTDSEGADAEDDRLHELFLGDDCYGKMSFEEFKAVVARHAAKKEPVA